MYLSYKQDLHKMRLLLYNINRSYYYLNLIKIMEKFSFEPKVNDYEKKAEQIANPSLKDRLSSFFETLEFSELKKKGITKEDVIRIDAELELEARKEAEGKDADSKEQKYLEKIKNSDLVFKQVIVPVGGAHASAWFTDSIKGDIKGQNVDVNCRYLMAAPGRRAEDGGESYNGSLDKKDLAEKDTKQIFDEYSEIAKKRMDAINKFITEKRAKTEEVSNREIK